jgi:hypothetical protein
MQADTPNGFCPKGVGARLFGDLARTEVDDLTAGTRQIADKSGSHALRAEAR